MKQELPALGRVRHLIAPRLLPPVHLGDWIAALPDARVRAVEDWTGAQQGHMRLPDAAAAQPWRGRIEQMIVRGRRSFAEPVFFHHASRSLIVADFIHNTDTAKLPVWGRPLIWFAGTDCPDGRMPPEIMKHFRGRRHELTDAVEAMLEWRPDRIIVSHGESFHHDGFQALRHAFGKLIRDREWERLPSRAAGARR